jgi:hypothetical protein
MDKNQPDFPNYLKIYLQHQFVSATDLFVKL